jgi:hypothetical protein
MKHFLKRLPLLLLLGSTTAIMANDYVSQTFFSIRPAFVDATPERISLNFDRLWARDDGIYGNLEIVPFGSFSTNGHELATYFFPFNKCVLTTGEFGSEAVANDSVDVLANYFGVLTRPVNEVFTGPGGLITENLTFQSRITMFPKQSTYGAGFCYRQHVYQEQTHPSRNIWIQAAFPIMAVSNSLNFCETIENEGGGEIPTGFVGSVGDALRGGTVFGDKQFYYGKVSNCARTQTGVGDIQLVVGFEDTSCHNFHRTWFGGIIVPTGNKPNGEYIFEPIVGNNGHWGLAMGGEFSYEWWESKDGDCCLWVYGYGYSYYLFQNTQRRSLDLVDKQWSRYMWLYPQQLPNGSDTNQLIYDIVPGINILTQNVNVSPRSTAMATTAFLLTTPCWSIEGGYNAYYMQEEMVCLNQEWPVGPAIAGIDQNNTNLFATKSNATIRHFLDQQGISNDIDAATGDLKYVPIKQTDLDLKSAAHPATIAHIAYGSAGYRWDQIKYPTLFGIGASYEFGAENTSLERVTIWGKLSVSF